MKIQHIDNPAAPLGFDAAMKLAQTTADKELGDNMLLSWYDRERDLESPRGASECHEGCPVKGYWDYALNRGGKLAVNFDQGRFVFCFQPVGEFE